MLRTPFLRVRPDVYTQALRKDMVMYIIVDKASGLEVGRSPQLNPCVEWAEANVIDWLVCDRAVGCIVCGQPVSSNGCLCSACYNFDWPGWWVLYGEHSDEIIVRSGRESEKSILESKGWYCIEWYLEEGDAIGAVWR